MPTIQENRFWETDYDWSRNGDEWSDQAQACNIPYATWKQSVAENFIMPNVHQDSTVVEIAPGHGRWTVYLLAAAPRGRVILVDLNAQCIAHCQHRFSKDKNIDFHTNDGKTLPFISDNSVDFIWSYDSFVHMERDVIGAYFDEFNRILKPGGKAVIHHAGRYHLLLPFSFLTKLRRFGRYAYQVISLGKFTRGDGWRSNVSKTIAARLARKNGLQINWQRNSWGAKNAYHVKLFHDFISELEKPVRAVDE